MAAFILWTLSARPAYGEIPLLIVPHPVLARAPEPGDWAKTRCGGAIFPTNGVSSWQWTPALVGPGLDYGDDGRVVTGQAVDPGMSTADNPLVHPFGYDFEWYVQPDPQDYYLVARGNANQMLGVEMDSGLAPPAYRVRDGDRVAVAGRWIVDCGHGDFHTEIHPPLFVAAARRSRSGNGIVLTIASRPWLIGQNYREGDFGDHLRREVMRLLNIPFTPYCCSNQVEARPPILPPFDAASSYDLLLALPPLGQDAVIRYHFAARPGVRVEMYRPKADVLAVHLSFDPSLFAKAALTTRHDVTYTPADLEVLDEDGRVKAGYDEAERRLGIAFWARRSLEKGIATDRYDSVVAPFAPCDPAAASSALVGISASRHLSMPPGWTSDVSPFPVIGWIAIEATPDAGCDG